MMTAVRTRYAGYRFPAEIIGHAVWLYFRFPLGLRMVEELLAARGIIVSHETVRQWALKFGQHFANQLRRRLPGRSRALMPPAFATVLARPAGLAPAIGACSIGTRSPKRRQNRAARSRAPRLCGLALARASAGIAIVTLHVNCIV